MGSTERKPVENPIYANLPVIQGKPQILCVDDEESGHIYMEAILGPQGYELINAKSGQEALDILESQRIDLVLLDIMMPDMNGYEVCRRIKTDERFVNIPVVMLTGLQTKEARIQSIEAGAEDFLQKMQNHEEISARVRMLLHVKFLNERLITSFKHIANLTSFGENIIRRFNPLHFDFMESIGGIVRQMIRKTSDMVDNPLIMIVGIRGHGNAWLWYQYEYVFQEMIRLPVILNPDLDIDGLLGGRMPEMVFFNDHDETKPELFINGSRACPTPKAI